ncbi:MAG: tryptophan--tRNA ligase, partial [Thermoprotei archaeon]
MASNEFVVTPWEVRGRVDYRKLIEEFGTQEITDELMAEIRSLTG